MKHLVLSLLLVSLVTALSAQKFEFGLNGGMVGYSVHNLYEGIGYNDFTHYQSAVTSPVVSLRAIYLYKNYQLGIALENKTFSYKGDNFPVDPIGSGLIIYPTYQYTNHETPVRIFANRVIHLKKLEIYGGLSAAWVFTKTQSKIIFPPDRDYDQAQNSTRLTAALQIGGTYFITKHIGINAEVSGEYNNFPAGPLDNNKISFPGTMGIRYKL